MIWGSKGRKLWPSTSIVQRWLWRWKMNMIGRSYFLSWLKATNNYIKKGPRPLYDKQPHENTFFWCYYHHWRNKWKFFGIWNFNFTSFNNVETISQLSWWQAHEPQFAHVEYLVHNKFLVFQALKYKLKGYLMWWVFLLIWEDVNYG